MRWLAAIVGVLAALAAPGAASGAECPDRMRIVFADGTRSCLTDHALANDDVVGQFGTDLRRLVPSHGYYAVAATPAAPQCKRAVGLDTLTANEAALGAVTDTARRTQKALQDCRLRVLGAGEDCRCRLVLLDGRSPLNPDEFARYSPPRGGAVAQAGPGSPSATGSAAPAGGGAAGTAAGPASAAAAGQAAAAAPSTPAGTGRRADGTGTGAGASSEEVAVLRQQIEALRQEMARGRPVGTESSALPAGPVRKARALVIGNSRYAHLGALPNPRRDAEAIAAKLRSFGIEVDLHLDTDRQALVKALTDFEVAAAKYDVNILFYAGHGLQVGGVNYMVPVDMRADGASAGSVKLNGVALDDAIDYLPAGTRVVFLDACRDNPLSRSLRNTRSGAGTGLAPMNTASGTLLSYATRDGSTAEDGTGQNSPYTTALLQHLGAEEDIALVLRRVRQSVLAATGQRQEPWEYGSLVGDQLVLSRLSR